MVKQNRPYYGAVEGPRLGKIPESGLDVEIIPFPNNGAWNIFSHQHA